MLSYNERLLVDVVQIQRQNVIFAPHIHAVVVLVHAKDPIVGWIEQEGKVVSGAGGLKLCLNKKVIKKKKKGFYLNRVDKQWKKI